MNKQWYVTLKTRDKRDEMRESSIYAFESTTTTTTMTTYSKTINGGKHHTARQDKGVFSSSVTSP